MIEKDMSFYSEGHRLAGTLYYRRDSSNSRGRPAIIINSGYQGFNSFYPKMFAQQLCEFGYVCVGFDYRGMAESEGTEGRVLIEEQVQDVRNAITFVRSQDSVRVDGVALIGWGMGAANVLLAAEKVIGLAAVAALNGFYDGERWMKSMHSYERWHEILDEISKDRIDRVLHGTSRMADPFEHYPMDAQTEDYVEAELSQVPGFGSQTRLQFTESIIDLKAEQAAANISPVPLFIAHGLTNLVHPYSEAQALFAAAKSPKTIYRIDGNHNDFMFADHPEFIGLCEQLHEFLDAAFEQNATLRRVITE